jgi:hypothetical protein
MANYDRPYDLGGTNYPPAGLLFLRLVSRFDPNNLSFFPIAGIMLGSLFFLFGASTKKHGGLVFLTSFPFVFGVVRGNLDLLAIFLIWVSVLAWNKEKVILAGITLGLAVSFKIWPIVFLFLFSNNLLNATKSNENVSEIEEKKRERVSRRRHYNLKFDLRKEIPSSWHQLEEERERGILSQATL